MNSNQHTSEAGLPPFAWTAILIVILVLVLSILHEKNKKARQPEKPQAVSK